MGTKEKFITEIIEGYSFKGESIILGTAIYENDPQQNLHIKIPLSTINRHGLIAGATGTGKTKTVQVFAEALSEKSIPVLLMDIKGDLSGLAESGSSNPKIEDRHSKIGLPYQPKKFPVEFLTLSNEKGVRLRATVSEFGPVLVSKILELNDTQAGLLAILFKYCDDNNLALLDLKDLKKVLQFANAEGKKEIEKNYGSISPTSTGTILRKVVELEQQGADKFFGEKSFEVEDLLRIDENGNGIISILRLIDLQDRPKLFSTFMLSLLAEIYSSFPELGDKAEPKLVIIIDEAHLIFNEASKTLLDQIETIIKLIRSKGVGIYFCTQNPTDVPASVLSQLGLKIQHALRAFTAQDRKMIKLTSENYPISEYYKTDELLTSLGIGEAAISALNEKGVPTPLAATLLCAPRSRMDILTTEELSDKISSSNLASKYNQIIDRESAYEILTKKLDASREFDLPIPNSKNGQYNPPQRTTARTSTRTEKSTMEKVINSPLSKQVGRTLVREIARGILGVLGVGGRRR
ncbi:MAG TPA: ATPase [Ignavibacteriales bacterium]|nr:ATPase [Ignavibacteriales bacterium]